MKLNRNKFEVHIFINIHNEQNMRSKQLSNLNSS